MDVWRQSAKGLHPNMCVSRSRIAAEILQQLGYQVEPVSVWLEVHRTDGPNPQVVIGVSPEIVRSPETTEIVAGSWSGHVVLRVDGADGPWLVDVTVGQFSSPVDGILTPEVVCFSWPPVCWASNIDRAPRARGEVRGVAMRVFSGLALIGMVALIALSGTATAQYQTEEERAAERPAPAHARLPGNPD